MNNKKSKEVASKKVEIPKPRKAIPCAMPSNDPDEVGKAYAKTITSPEVAACRVVSVMQGKEMAEGIDIPGMLDLLREQSGAVNGGDLKLAEAMLMNQAVALQSIFVRLLERSAEQTIMSNIEGFMRQALRAQSQCRATLETLATIKNPPVVYARQANVTTGPQQVNNGIPALPRARETGTEQNKLIEAQHGMDIGTAAATSGVNQAMATLGGSDRAKD